MSAQLYAKDCHYINDEQFPDPLKIRLSCSITRLTSQSNPFRRRKKMKKGLTD